MSIAVAVDALRRDADMWDQVSQVTRRAGEEAGALSVGESVLSWASVPTGLLATYAEVQDKVVMLLGEATQTYRALSATLDQVAHVYQLSDDDAARQFEGVWDVRE